MRNCVGAVLGILEVDVRWYVSRHQCQEMLHDHQGGDFGGGGGRRMSCDGRGILVLIFAL